MTQLGKELDSDAALLYAENMAARKLEWTTILNKERHLAKRRAELEQAMSALAQEESELAITKRTVAKMIGIELEAMAEQPRGKGRGKPKDIPSVYDMTARLLRESGQDWLETQEIIRLIRERWWPSAEGNDIAPTLWRLQKDKKLRKDGTRYAMPKSP